MLQSILEAIKEMKPDFFKTLDKATTVLETAFKFIKERKLPDFSSATIDTLVRLDFEALNHISQRPSALLHNNQPQISTYIREI